MKQQPVKVKFKKSHKKKNFKGTKGKKLILYGIGISIKKQKYHTYNQFEAARKIIARKLKPKEVKNKKNLKNIRSALKKKKKRRKKMKKKFLLLRLVL